MQIHVASSKLKEGAKIEPTKSVLNLIDVQINKSKENPKY